MDFPNYKVDFEFKDNMLYVNLSGVFPNELLKSKGNVYQPLIDACSTNNCKKALVDIRDLQIQLNTMEYFQTGEATTSLTQYGLRIAFLVREDLINRFFETVALNRGGLINIFTDMDSAINYLQN